MSSKQVATLLGVSVQWVELERYKKRGPKWVVLGPRCIRYRMADVTAWLKERAQARAKYETARKRALRERRL
jgi:predicted DNA-binding transcriptional regulator AlpA